MAASVRPLSFRHMFLVESATSRGGANQLRRRQGRPYVTIYLLPYPFPTPHPATVDEHLQVIGAETFHKFQKYAIANLESASVN